MVNNIVPVKFYPTKILLIDDNEAFLSTLSLVLSEYFFVETVSQPSQALALLSQSSNIADSRAKAWDIRVNDTEDSFEDEAQLGVSLDFNKNYDEPGELLSCSEFSVVVMDYSMPEMNGFELAKKLDSYVTKKIMLTGIADHELAVNAFNLGVIDRFIVKNSTNVIEQLIDAIRVLQIEYFVSMYSDITNYLKKSNPFVVSREYAELIESFMQQTKSVAHYQIDVNGSRIFVNADGVRNWLMFKSKENILQYYSVAEGNSAPEPICHDLQKCLRMPCFLSEHERDYDVNDWDKIMYPTEKIGDMEIYMAKICRLTAQGGALPRISEM